MNGTPLRIFTVEVDAGNDDYDLIAGLTALAEEVAAVNDGGYVMTVTEDRDVIFTSQADGAAG